jgi:hypothetical protein
MTTTITGTSIMIAIMTEIATGTIGAMRIDTEAPERQ